MNSPYPLLNIKPLSLVLSLITLTGCCSAPPEPTYINVKPKVGPLSETLLHNMQPTSTVLLKKADVWLENSETLLNSVK